MTRIVNNAQNSLSDIVKKVDFDKLLDFLGGGCKMDLKGGEVHAGVNGWNC